MYGIRIRIFMEAGGGGGGGGGPYPLVVHLHPVTLPSSILKVLQKLHSNCIDGS